MTRQRARLTRAPWARALRIGAAIASVLLAGVAAVVVLVGVVAAPLLELAGTDFYEPYCQDEPLGVRPWFAYAAVELAVLVALIGFLLLPVILFDSRTLREAARATWRGLAATGLVAWAVITMALASWAALIYAYQWGKWLDPAESAHCWVGGEPTGDATVGAATLVGAGVLPAIAAIAIAAWLKRRGRVT